MALIQDNRGFASLIQMTGAGLNIADYPAIKRALIEKYKEIYGSDIDLANTTADGVFVETLALMIFNILQNVKFLYSNLDIRTASGKFLDSLAALSGVYRNGATKSKAQLEITNKASTPLTLTYENNLVFVDQVGITWRSDISAQNPITLETDVVTLIDVYCDQVGPINAPAGWINQLVTTDVDLVVNQPEEATVGSFAETDNELRSRRNEVISSQGLTVLSNLKGALLNITGINDAVIYNNPEDDSTEALDGTTIERKSIYVALKKAKNVQISDSIIGTIIYEKLTPGINTNNFDGDSSTGEAKSYQYTQSTYLGQGTSTIPVYWKEATAINKGLSIRVSYKPGEFFATADDNSINIMKKTLQEFLNGLNMNETFTTYDLVQLLNDEDPMFNNKKTYNVINVELFGQDEASTSFNKTLEEGSLYEYQTKDTYFEINSFGEVEKDDSQTIKYVTFIVNG